MKKLMIILFVATLWCKQASAQNCSQFVNNVNGKKLTYVSADAKGKEQMKAVYITTKKDASTVTVHGEAIDKNGKSLGSGDSEMICEGTAIKIDMKAFIPAASLKQYSNMQMSGEAKYLTYPVKLTAGQTLDDGSVTINVSNNGSQMGELQMNIINRKVEKAETITTAAGNFDCFKITYNAALKMKIMGMGIPFNMNVIEWYAPKLGRFVKSETYNSGAKLSGTMILQSIN